MLAHQMVCYSHQSDRSIMGIISHQSNCRIRGWVSHQSDHGIGVCLYQSERQGTVPYVMELWCRKKGPKVDQELITNGLLRTLGTTSIKQSMKYTSMK